MSSFLPPSLPTVASTQHGAELPHIMNMRTVIWDPCNRYCPVAIHSKDIWFFWGVMHLDARARFVDNDDFVAYGIFWGNFKENLGKYECSL